MRLSQSAAPTERILITCSECCAVPRPRPSRRPQREFNLSRPRRRICRRHRDGRGSAVSCTGPGRMLRRSCRSVRPIFSSIQTVNLRSCPVDLSTTANFVHPLGIHLQSVSEWASLEAVDAVVVLASELSQYGNSSQCPTTIIAALHEPSYCPSPRRPVFVEGLDWIQQGPKAPHMRHSINQDPNTQNGR